MVTGSSRGRPVHRLAWAALLTAVCAGVLAVYGAMYAEKHLAGSPLREARGATGTAVVPRNALERQMARAETAVLGERLDDAALAATQRSKRANYALQLAVFVLPFALGLGAAQIGAQAMAAVERAGGAVVGNTLSVFAMLIGGLAAVTAACMMVSLYVWPRLPSLYTT